MSVTVNEIQDHWTHIQPFLTIWNEREYDQAVERLNHLIGEVGTNEQHPLYGLLDTLGSLVHAYEEEHYPVSASSGADILQFFMEEHGLRQSDLPEVGSQGVISEILRGKRKLNVRQIRTLAKRFNVSPAVFF